MRKLFARFAHGADRATGSPYSFALAVVAIIVWGATGPFFHYSDTWQLVINTGTTIITFLMVFLLQASAVRSGGLMQSKLDTLITEIREVRDQKGLVGAQDRPDQELSD